MGFGVLLAGYALAFAFTLSSVYFFADVLGGLMMAYACSKLAAYDRRFRLPMIASAVYAAAAVAGALRRFVFGSSSALFDRVYDAAYAAIVVVLHFALFYAIVSITRDLKLKRITMKARRNLIFMIVFYTLQALAQLFGDHLSENYPKFTAYLFRFILIFQLLLVFVNLLLIGSCLKNIGEEGEDAPDPEPSKLKRFYSSWSEKEDKIFTPKDRKKNFNNKRNKKR